jgi:hypothetical protein
MNGPIPVTRSERGVSAPRLPARKGKADDVAPSPEQDRIDAQHAAFDFEAAERAELMREHAVLEALVMEQLKNEDEIVKKFIALIT